MKKLNTFDKFIFFFNSIIAVLLLLSYLLPYIEPKRFPVLSVLSLSVPFLILLNVFFLLYWLLKVKKQLLLSLIVLLIGYSYLGSLYKFSASKYVEDSQNISVMTYNVRLFNLFDWIHTNNVDKKIVEFIQENQPDILCIQDYRRDKNIQFSGYHKYEKITGKKIKNGQAIFSKFPIINSGSVAFKDTYNNAIFIDVLKGLDTIRIYNIHLQSMKIDSNVDALKKESSENLLRKVSKTFAMQQVQTELFLKHKNKCHYKIIIAGDFNNTAYSYVYKEIKGEMQDAFVEAGNGFGRTFNFKFFPVRIDFILVDDHFEVNHFKTFEVQLSDHYPIMSRVKIRY